MRPTKREGKKKQKRNKRPRARRIRARRDLVVPRDLTLEGIGDLFAAVVIGFLETAVPQFRRPPPAPAQHVILEDRQLEAEAGQTINLSPSEYKIT